MTAAMLFRGIFDLFGWDYKIDHYYLEMIIFTICSKFLPIGCQFGSLVFGFIR